MNGQVKSSVELARSLVLGVLATLILSACSAPAWKKPVPLGEVPGVMQYAVTQTQDDVTVTVVVPTKEQTSLIFGTSLYNDHIQPVWVEVDNQGKDPLFLLKIGMDEDYFSPLEASYQRHSGSKETRHRMDLFFHQMSFTNPALPGEVTSGWVFTNLDEGIKAVNIDLLGDGRLYTYSLVVKVPGLVVDVAQVDLDNIYSEFTDLKTEQELKDTLNSLPCCTVNKKGDKNGDPLNVVFIGARTDIFSGLIRRDWHLTEVTYGASAWKTIKSFMFGTRYRYSPISPLYVFGRPQDMGLQKARDSIHLRNHMRIWRAPYNYRGEEIYIAQISRDVGVKFNKRTITTHAIDPDVDDTRNGLLQDLAYSQSMYAFGYVGGSQRSTLEDTYYNLTPDPYYSDGLRAVMFFAGRPTTVDEVEILDWEKTKNLKMLDWDRNR